MTHTKKWGGCFIICWERDNVIDRVGTLHQEGQNGTLKTAIMRVIEWTSGS